MKYLIMLMLISCSPKPLVIEERIDAVKYVKCMTLSRNEGAPLSRIKKQCKQYATVTNDPVKPLAVAVCSKWKSEEIGWTKWEIKKYCNRMWRGYKGADE